MKNQTSFLLRAILFLSIGCAPILAGPIFDAGNLVVVVEGNGTQASQTYTDNQAAPLTLYQYKPNGTSSASFVNWLVLPQTSSGPNFAVSGEYGSSSEGTIQLSGNGRYLTVMGYGVNANTFNSNPGAFGPDASNTALAQSGSVLGQGYTAVPRVVALIDASGNVDSSTAVYGVFSTNNPRSAYTADGVHIYISGQGAGSDHTGGVFYTTLGSQTATPITGDDTASKTFSQDTRTVQIVNGQLYVSVDSKGGSGSNRDFIGTLGTAGSPPVSLANSGNGPTRLPGYGNSGGTGKVTLTASQTNGINAAGKEVNLSPNNFFFADANTLYVADTGLPKNDSVTNDSNGSTLGDGGLQKWSLISGNWVLDYTLADGLGLVPNNSSSGTTGLYGLTGMVVGGVVQLYATNYTIGDLDQTYLFGINDSLSATTKPVGESFTLLATAPADTAFKGVSFAPTSAIATPEPSSWALTGLGLAMLLGYQTRKAMKLRLELREVKKQSI